VTNLEKQRAARLATEAPTTAAQYRAMACQPYVVQAPSGALVEVRGCPDAPELDTEDNSYRNRTR
jgi:hypothetical protein